MSIDWERYREEFETIKKGIVFMNHAGVSPLPRCAADAMKQAIDANRTLSVDDWMGLQAKVTACRESIARFLNVSAGEIAFSRNTTEGINWVANGIGLQSGDRVVTVSEEYPANIYPWMRLRDRGIELHLIEPVDHRVTLEQIESAITPNTKIVGLSLVEFASGFRFDLDAVGDLCRRKNVLLAVDVIQGMGAVPFDLKKAGVAFASGAAQKWMLGPVGAGFFFCNREFADRIEVTTAGADTVRNPIPYLHYDYAVRDEAPRFEYSTPAVHAVIAWGASLQMFLACGMETISNHIKDLTGLLIDGAKSKGYTCHSPRGNNEWSGIVSLSHPQISVDAVVDQLAGKNVFTREREGRARLSPHFYQTENDMKIVIDAL